MPVSVPERTHDRHDDLAEQFLARVHGRFPEVGEGETSESRRHRMAESSYVFLVKLHALGRASAYDVFREVANASKTPYHTDLPMQSAYRAARQLEELGLIQEDGFDEQANGVRKQFFVITDQGRSMLLQEVLRHLNLALSAIDEGLSYASGKDD